MSARDTFCAGKYRFETMTEAQRVARAARHRKNALRQAAYRCDVCKGFHIGTGSVRRLARDRRAG